MELTLEKAINTARQAETVKKQQEAFKNNSGNNIYALRKNAGRKNVISKPEAPDNSFTGNKTVNSCYWCGKLVKHTKFNCPAHKAICNKCEKVGHYAKVCKAKVSINEIGEPNQSSFLGHVKGSSNINNSVKKQFNQWNADIFVGDIPLNFKIDTGADVTVIPHETYNRVLSRVKLQETNRSIHGPGKKNSGCCGSVHGKAKK
ncbi:uncharacterized protein LOC111637075 [Centruroides sculpturatus]|uniref:uncharacterized protein LOC111637075 n=1 Tax=Centruroides sculpturatus TaxID=218467 RepID=UPI000C6E66F5|nr:uncharacterized protein LOC111637075 [Centruroides sculpturatus]